VKINNIWRVNRPQTHQSINRAICFFFFLSPELLEPEMEQAGGLDSLGLARDSAERAVAFEATKHTSTMPSVAGMGLEFSCGEDPKLVPAVATGAEPHGAAPEEFVAIMTAALKGASRGLAHTASPS
jgi:hypothetical protein